MKENKVESLKNIYQELPIPILPGVAGWKEIPIYECGEGLVPIGLLTKYDQILTDPVYFGWTTVSPYEVNEIDGSLITMFVRERVAEKLDTISKSLPPNIRLVVLDAFRPLEVQQALYNQFISQLQQEHSDWNIEQLSTETQKYVSLPSKDKTKPSPHNTGGAVDVCLVKLSPDIMPHLTGLELEIKLTKDAERKLELEVERWSVIKSGGEMLEYGTQFDLGDERAALDYFEKQKQKRNLTPMEIEALKNRRWLYWIMKKGGFEAYPDEWWHFNDNKTQMGTKTSGGDASEYGAAQLTELAAEFESFIQKIVLTLSINKTVTKLPFRKSYWLQRPERIFEWPNVWKDFPNAEKISPK
jgi:D-alanyl-D-alanine dipeptidase